MKTSPQARRSLTGLIGLLVALPLGANAAGRAPLTVELPAGSSDGLAGAVAAVGAGGTVVVKSGWHDETGTVVVDRPVRIVGEPGAVLRCGVLPSPLLFPVEPAHVRPVLHLLGADGAVVRGLEFVPAQELANCAVLVENSDHVEIAGNGIHGFQFGVLIQRADFATVARNTIECAPLWVLDPRYAFVVEGINVVNGEHAQLVGNRVSGAWFGLFGNDQAGRMEGNTAEGCYIGFIACHALYGLADVASSGEPLGADVACTSWHIQNNVAAGNFLCGYLAVDGANRNVFSNNAAAGNGLDLILTGDGDFFGVGIPLPGSHDNQVVAGSQAGLTLMDCGIGNAISGGFHVVDCP